MTTRRPSLFTYSVLVPSDRGERIRRWRAYYQALKIDRPDEYEMLVKMSPRSLDERAEGLSDMFLDQQPGEYEVAAIYADPVLNKQFKSTPVCFNVYYEPYPNTFMDREK